MKLKSGHLELRFSVFYQQNDFEKKKSAGDKKHTKLPSKQSSYSVVYFFVKQDYLRERNDSTFKQISLV